MRELNRQWRGRLVNICGRIRLMQIRGEGETRKARSGWGGAPSGRGPHRLLIDISHPH